MQTAARGNQRPCTAATTSIPAHPSHVGKSLSKSKKIIKDKSLAERLQKNAFNQYENKYTWIKRAYKILSL